MTGITYARIQTTGKEMFHQTMLIATGLYATWWPFGQWQWH